VNPLTDVSDSAESVEGVDARFQRFYEEQYASTVRLARLLTGEWHAAEDVAQDAFVKVYRYAETSQRPIDNPAACCAQRRSICVERGTPDSAEPCFAWSSTVRMRRC
jgi:hypothetical protein